MKAIAIVAGNKWYRRVLLVVLGYEALGCLLGGSLLIIAPDGSLMHMPVDIMHGAFRDFLIPGILLFVLGILNAIAFTEVFCRTRFNRVVAGVALGGLLVWFWIEIAILQQLHWLHLMWGLPVVAASLAMVLEAPVQPMVMRKALLACGILSSLLYVIINVVVAMQWEEYNSASQTVSELSAIGAPTRMLWTILCAPYTLLMIAFSFGVLKSAGRNHRLHIAGNLLLIYGLLGLLWPLAPMHLRETLAEGGSTVSDTIHIALGIVTEIIYLFALGLAAAVLGRKFRIYSIVTFLVLLVCGILTFLAAPGVAAGEPTPLIGVWERINIGVFLLWIIVLAVFLWREP